MSKSVDLSGNIYGKLIVIGRGDDYVSPTGSRLKRWSCKCECGNIINVTTSQLKRGMKSCGCISKREDLIGRRFERLIVLYSVEDYISPKGYKLAKWHCLCDCGKEIDVLGMSLKNGDCKSCGCYNKDIHNKRKTKSIDYSGQVFGDLSVIHKIAGKKPTKYLCKCLCGNEIEVLQRNLTNGSTRHCGCKSVRKIRASRVAQKSIVGQTFGELLVLTELEPHITPNGSKQRRVKCKCSCGEEIIIGLSLAKKNGKCTKCMKKKNRKDVTGQRFGKLVVTSMADDYISPSGFRLSRCNCICDCGNSCTVNMSTLVTGKTRSCGCLHNTAGLLKDNPELMRKYDFDKNNDINLNTLTARTSKKIWWKCTECGNSWYATIASQNDKIKHGCPYCSGRLVTKGKNDLASQNPDVLFEWDYEKNTIRPDEIHSNSGIKVWWKCSECGHSWKQTVGNRVYNMSGCPKCNIENVNSFCEQAVYFYVRKLYPDAINGDDHLGMELDIFIPSRGVAIEYDGEVWHNNVKKIEIDNRKNMLCINNGIELIRIREPKCKEISDCTIFNRVDSTSNNSLDIVIKELLDYLYVNNNISVNSTRDTSLILEQFATKKFMNSLAYCYPEIAKEWHPTKNGLLTPEKINKSARYVVWWLGKCGHEWQMPVSARTSKPYFDNKHNKTQHKPQGCPYCSGKRILLGFNDLESKYPEFASQWDFEKNGDLKPTDVLAGSSKKFWWKCSKGHSFFTSPDHRISHSGMCPECYKQKRSPAVICIETGQCFESGIKAAEYVGLKVANTIYKCCRGEAKTAKGYHWKYADEE